MNYDVIRNLLNAQLQTVDGLPDLQIENVRLAEAIKGEKPYCRTNMLTAEPTPLTVGYKGLDEYQGLYQIDLFFPLGYGTADSNAMSDAIQAVFPRGTILGSGTEVHVRMCWQDTSYAMKGDTWYTVPVKVRWVAYHLT